MEAHGPERVRFYTRLKTMTARWPAGIRAGAEYVMPTMRQVWAQEASEIARRQSRPGLVFTWIPHRGTPSNSRFAAGPPEPRRRTRPADDAARAVASAVVCQGASLDEAGDMLRYRSPASTMIYANDTEGLRSIAQP
jgi:hypothetical protein